MATNCEQTYLRYLRPGDRVTMRTVIDDISTEKATALGTGHFVTTRQDYYDGDDDLVGSMLFRIFRFQPAGRRRRAGHWRPDPAEAAAPVVDARQHVVVRGAPSRAAAGAAMRRVRRRAPPAGADVPPLPEP